MFKRLVVGTMAITIFLALATTTFADAAARYTNEEIEAGIILKAEDMPSTVPVDPAKDSLVVAFNTTKDYPIVVSLFKVEPVGSETIVANDVAAKDKKVILDKAAKKPAEVKKPETTEVLVYGPEEMSNNSTFRYYHPVKNPKLGAYRLEIRRTDKSKDVVKEYPFEVVPKLTTAEEVKKTTKGLSSDLINTTTITTTNGTNK